MGSSNQWERGTKLLGSAIELVTKGARTPEQWADYLQAFVFGQRTMRVNKSDRALQPFNRDEFRYINPALKPEHYPLRGTGIQERQPKLVNLWEIFDHNPTTEELFNLAKGGDEMPDFADTKTYHTENPEEATDEHPIIGLCGSVLGQGGDRKIAYFYASSDGWSLCLDRVDAQWGRDYRLLLVC